MPRVLWNIDSICGLEDNLLGTSSGGCCDFGSDAVASGLEENPVPTEQEQVTAEASKVNTLANIAKRIYKAIQDPEMTIESFAVFAQVVMHKKMSMTSYPGLMVAMLTKLEALSAKIENTARDLLLLTAAEKFLADASSPSVCLTEFNRMAYIGTHTFEDYGQVILENI
jgi:hypothetical protein